MKSNYQSQLDSIISSLEKNAGTAQDSATANAFSYAKPRLLLHACCGPCSSYVLEYLSKYFDITILYYNPNIAPEEEYFRRLEELKNLLPRFKPAVENKVKLVEDSYNPEEFYSAIGVRENPELAHEPEKGERCRRCYKFRLERAFIYAAKHGFDYFCTTLSISPFKDAEKINIEGKLIEEAAGTKVPEWLPSDFKKKGGFKRSLELSEEYGLYRQQYCGCIYSKINTEKQRSELSSKYSEK